MLFPFDVQVTQFSGVPPMLLMMANSELVNDFDLTSLRFIHSGAAPLPSTIADLIRKRLGCGIDQGRVFYSIHDVSTSMTIIGHFTPNLLIIIESSIASELL